MKKSAIILSGIFVLTLLLGGKGYITLAAKVFDTITGANKIEAPELKETEDEGGSNPEAFIIGAQPDGEIIHEQAGIADRILQLENTILHVENKIEDYFNNGAPPVKNGLISLNGGFQGAIGRSVIVDAANDDGVGIVKLDNGYLASFYADNSQYQSRESIASDLISLNAHLSEKNIPLVYAHAPYKSEYADLPLENHAKDYYAFLDGRLKEAKIEAIDLKQAMDNAGMEFFSSYYKTDHHWKAETGLWCAGLLAGYFSDNYGFEYDRSLLNPDNYAYEVLGDFFLGSQGRRVGALFAGVDDFTVIHPNFETNLETDTLLAKTSEWAGQVLAEDIFVGRTLEYRTGGFEQVMYWAEHVEEIDYFGDNPYAMYLNGDHPIQIIRNNNAIDDKKILVVKHSFADVTMPILSLAVKEINIVDLRLAGRPENLYDYIDEYNPDLVLFLW
jgi:hypothetical protein